MIGGYRPGSNGVDSLLVGYYDETGLRFGGKVRAGFVPQPLREIFKALKPHRVDGLSLLNVFDCHWFGVATLFGTGLLIVMQMLDDFLDA